MADNNHLILQYQEQSLLTMSKGELLVKLYDELLKNLKLASALFGQKQNETAMKCTAKSKNIINYLFVILDDRYALSASLKQIYSHLLSQIILANASGDPSYLDRIVPQVQELRGAWVQAEKATRVQGREKEKERAVL